MFFGTIYSQEDLNGDQNALSIGYSNTIIEDSNFPAFGFGSYFNKGYAFGLAIQPIENEVFPSFYFSFYSMTDRADMAVSILYSETEYYSLPGLAVSPKFRILPESSFPVLISPIITFIYAVRKGFKSNNELQPTAGISIIQGLFAHSELYPYLGIGYSYNLYGNIGGFTLALGINIALN